MDELIKQINSIKEERTELKRREEKMYCIVATLFMTKYNTNKIFFDYEEDAPSWEYIGCSDSDIQDCYVTSITFNEDGTIKEVTAYCYYESDNVLADKTEFISIDYLELAEYITTQIESGQVILDEDEL